MIIIAVNLLDKKDMNLIMDSSISTNEPKIYECLKAAWDESPTGLKYEHLERVMTRFPNEVVEIKNTARFIKEKYVDLEWKANSYIAVNKVGKCERCGANLKHLFNISNKINHNTKIVGVECLTRISEHDEEMNREAYNLLMQKRPDYEVRKEEMAEYFKNKRYPYPNSIIVTSKNPYSQLVSAEKKLRKFSVDAVKLIDDIIRKLDEVIELKAKLEKFHQVNKGNKFYCDSEIYKDISGDIKKEKLVESNNSIITREIANELKSKTLVIRYKDEIEKALNITNLTINEDNVFFNMKHLKVIVKSNELHKIINDIIFTKKYDREKFRNLSIEIEKDALYRDFDNIINEYRQKQKLTRVEFDFIRDDYDDLIKKGNMYVVYKKDYFTTFKIGDISTSVSFIEKIRKQLDKIPKTEWFDSNKLNDMRDLSRMMSESPGRNS